MKYINRRFTIWFCVLAFILMDVAVELWSKVFPETEVVVINATDQDLRGIVIELPGESVSFEAIPACDYAVMTIRRRIPQRDFVPLQRGTMADGTSIKTNDFRSGEGVPFRRVVYVVQPDGKLRARLDVAAN